MKNKIIMTGASICILIFSVKAQWQTEVRLTNNPAVSSASHVDAKCIAVSGNVVHVVWYDDRDGNTEIYYKRSTDNGATWGSDVRLTNQSSDSKEPSIGVNGTIVSVVWQDHRNGDYDIYYKRSLNGGLSWEADVRLTTSSNNSYSPSVSVSGNYIHVALWHNLSGNTEIYYVRSTNYGTDWDSPLRLTNNSAYSDYPSIAASGSRVHIIWIDSRNTNNEIYYNLSTDYGNNWSGDIRLTNYASYKVSPTISVSGSTVHAAWGDERNGAGDEIYYKRSTNGGVSWNADTRLSNLDYESYYPSIHASGSFVHLVWQDNYNNSFEIYYKRSTNDGATWGTNTRLTVNSGNSQYPSVTVGGSYTYVAWDDNQHGNYEMYFRRNPTGNPVGIVNINTEAPKEFSLSQNYPNPFNPVTKIRFNIPLLRGVSEGRGVFVQLIIYDILGKEAVILVDEDLNPGVYEVDWDASNYPSGVYFYKITMNDFSDVKKMILVR